MISELCVSLHFRFLGRCFRLVFRPSVFALMFMQWPACAAVEDRSYEVVPSVWVTGKEPVANDARAFVFPSVLPGQEITDPDQFDVPGALKPSSCFEFYSFQPD